MITAFTVRNFKAIGEEPVRIDLKPITLLFGPNSSGKSSILHALHYAYEVFNNHNLTPKTSILGGNSLDLGGFERFVHNNDLSRNIVIRFDFESDYEIFRNLSDKLRTVESDGIKQYFVGTSFNLVGVNTSYVEVGISWSKMHKKPYVGYYEIGFNGEKMATINYNIDKEEAILCYLNIDNPLFYDVWVDHGITIGSIIENTVDSSFYKTDSTCHQESIKVNELIKQEKNKIKGKFNKENAKSEDKQYEYNQKINKYISIFRKKLLKKYNRIPPCSSIPNSGENNLNIVLRQHDALPNWNEPLQIDTIWKEYSEEDMVTLIGDQPFIIPNNRSVLKNLLTCILTQPSQYIVEIFSMRYLGPLREIPSRNFSGVDPHEESNNWRWATGLAAWDLIYWIGQQQLDSLGYLTGWSSSEKIQPAKRKIDIKKYAIQELDNINDWLKRLNTGYQIFIEYYREIPSNHPLLGILTSENILTNIHNLVEDINQLPQKIRIWLQDEFQNKLTPHEIGVGISQILPVVVAAAGKNWGASFVVIEQPELHIHPAMQVQLADLFISHARTKKNHLSAKNIFINILRTRHFMIETHSEHLLLRILRRIRETAEEQVPDEFKLLSHEVAVYYVESENGNTQINNIGLDENGRFTDRWPKGFFAERMQEMLPSDIRERVESKRRGKP